MINRLRNKFIQITMFSVAIVLVFVLGTLNLINFHDRWENAVNILAYLSENDGYFPAYEKYKQNPDHTINFDFTEETPYENRYFSVTASHGTITQINMSHVAAVSATQAYFYAKEVLAKGRDVGIIDSYVYMVSSDGDDEYIVFLDRRTELESLMQLMVLSIVTMVFCLLIVFILVASLSKKAIEPVLENMEKQKQFITDAGHEIKTPLAIISADTDVIEIESGKSEWTESIRNQVVRLGELTQDMLTLAKMEDNQKNETFTKFNISQVAEDIVDEFRPMAVKNQVKFLTEITPDIEINGSEQEIHQLFSVLLNNAFKYVNDQGTIWFHLYKKRSSVILELDNTADNLPDGDLNKLFDRFYRADNARSRETGGYGIGLSIARAACEHHKGNISAKKLDEHKIRFKAVLNA